VLLVCGRKVKTGSQVKDMPPHAIRQGASRGVVVEKRSDNVFLTKMTENLRVALGFVMAVQAAKI